LSFECSGLQLRHLLHSTVNSPLDEIQRRPQQRHQFLSAVQEFVAFINCSAAHWADNTQSTRWQKSNTRLCDFISYRCQYQNCSNVTAKSSIRQV